LSPLVSAGRHLVTIAILVLILFFANRRGTDSELVSNLVLVAVVLAAGVVSWLVTRWQVAEGVLRIETGLIRRESRRFPLSQIQAIDVAQTGLARVLGLAELRLRMAGADSSGGRLASLPLADAEHLRQRLLAMARLVVPRSPEHPRARHRPPGAVAPSGRGIGARRPEQPHRTTGQRAPSEHPPRAAPPKQAAPPQAAPPGQAAQAAQQPQRARRPPPPQPTGSQATAGMPNGCCSGYGRAGWPPPSR
jgi:membrane protein YdbS with pleckstrin-like domain